MHCRYTWYNLTYYQQGFIVQWVEHPTSIAEVVGLNSVETSECFSLQLLWLLHNCKDHYYIIKHLSCLTA